MSAETKNLPTKLGDDTTLLPVPGNITFATNFDALGAGDTFLVPQFLSESEADDAFRQLAVEITYQQWFHMASDKPTGLKPLSRTKCALALPLQRSDGSTWMPHYRFPVNDQQRYPVVPINEQTPTLLKILRKVQEKTHVDYNHVVVLYYKDGNDAIGFHKDKTLDLAEDSSIVSLSLGAERPYVLRKGNIFNPSETQQFTLPHGSLLSLGAKTNADWYHSVIMLKDDTSVKPRISITFRKVETYRNGATGELSGKGVAYPGLNWPSALNGNHRSDNYLEVPLDCSALLQVWFGAGEQLVYNGGLWWRGMMQNAQGDNERDRRAYTDKYIHEKWGAMIDSDQGIVWAKTTTPLGALAAIILYDQLPRQAFRGTSKAFQTDPLACAIANELLDKQPALFSSSTLSPDTSKCLPWTYQIFVYFALLHSENITNCERGACGLANLHEILKAPGFKETASRLMPLLKSAKEHLQTLSKFGRYPHRNLPLGRESTAEEIAFLQHQSTTWMNSQLLRATTQSASVTTMTSMPKTVPSIAHKNGFRVLVLHSNRQSPVVFQKKTRDVLARAVGEGGTLVYASAPHKYVAQGEALANTLHLLASQSESTRCWWNATDDPETMLYNGVEETIKYIDQVAKLNGPFDGIIGFSQGGTLAGLLAALISDKSPLVANLATLQFCVIISGFFVRDTRLEYFRLTGPLRDKASPIQIPSFHVWGLHDQLVLPERSKALRDSFAEIVNNVPRCTTTHELDHFAKAISVWPVDNIRHWIQSNFVPRAFERPKSLIDLLFAVRDKRYIAITEKTNVDEQLAAVMGHLQLSEEDIKLSTVNVVLLERKIFPPKFKNMSTTAQALVKLGKQYREATDWTDKVKTVLAVFPNSIGAFYVADKSVTVFRDGIVAVVLQSIQQSLERKKCDYIAEHLPAKNNRYYAKNGLLARIVAPFKEVHMFKRDRSLDVTASYENLCNLVEQHADKTDHTGDAKRQSNVKKGARNADQLEEMLATPLSDAIINPTPEPVNVASREEMQHLHAFLRSEASENSKIFPRGTICADGRLDLCKQVIGPAGVADLQLSLQVDGSSATPKVKHLLLGNNIAGIGLANAVAKLIKQKTTSITTWYIAGNELDAAAFAPVAEALETDNYVLQLWLKRNPLKSAGALPLAKMLRVNACLKVLDLTNTGLLDNGTRAICDAVAANKQSALSVLYLESNGITSAAVPSICAMIRASKIVDLCLGCNRIGDKGATVLAEVLQYLEHLDLSSCGIGPKGAEAIATVLGGNTSVKKLDLGLLKSTNAMKEIPNAMSSQGATALANALVRNTTLLYLNLLHNGIYQQGVADLAKALTSGNNTLLYLNIEQLGIPSNELTRETIRVALKRNWLALSADQQRSATSAMTRDHLADIKSVYRNEQ